ncbi:MAG: tetratricopeptide repeat protein [Phycisphaerales bacterium]
MVNPTEPSSPASNRPMVVAAAVLGLIAVAIGALAVRSAMTGPRSAEAAGATAERQKGGASAAAVEAGLEAAATYQRDNRFEQAATILAKLAETNPTDLTVRRAYAQALLGLKQYDRAYEQYQAAVSLLPVGSTRQIAQGADAEAAQLHFEAGTCATMAGKADRSIEHYSMAQTANPREPKYPLYLAMVQIKAGTADAESAAMASLLRAAKLNPELAEAWGTLAELELRRDQLGLAAQHIAEARRLQPAVAKWRLVEARILNRRGEAEQAATLLLALDQAQRRQPAVLTVLGESYGLLRRPADAAKMYADAFAAVAPDGQPNAEFAFQAALWFERAGDGTSAAKFATSASMLGHEGARAMAERLKSK